jgi:hypothetical protein
MIIPDPGECAQGTDNDGDVGNRPDDDGQFRVDLMVAEVVHDFEKEPANTGYGTATVDASKMLR